MKNSLLLLGAVALAAMTLKATASDALLSPRAATTQIKTVAAPANDVNLAAQNNALVSPRAASNAIKTVAGTSNDVNAAAECAKAMNGTPKQVAECTSHTTMPLCNDTNVAAK